MTIKTILFDFGGVLYRLPDATQVEEIKALFHLEETPELLHMLHHPDESDLARKIFLGQLPEETMWTQLAERYHLSEDKIKQFKELAFSPRQFNRELAEFLGTLHQTYQTAILSNAGDQTRHLMVDIYHLDQWVETIIISAEEGLMKPDPAIYQVAMDRLGAQPGTTLFLDDDENNIQAANAFGMHAVQYFSNEQAMRDIRQLLDEEG
ncbi:HAD family phosphatase [bacterium]|nr:HAD family phosphatase [bacterium]